MVPDLVRDDIGTGKISRSTEFGGKLPVEGQIDIDFLISGTVERPCRRTGKAARGSHLSAKQHQLRASVHLAQSLEIRAPDGLGLTENRAQEVNLRIVGI